MPLDPEQESSVIFALNGLYDAVAILGNDPEIRSKLVDGLMVDRVYPARIASQDIG